MNGYNTLIINITGDLMCLLFLLTFLTVIGLNLMNERSFLDCSIFFKCPQSPKKASGAILVLICLSIGYALTLGNVISINNYSVPINWWSLFIYTLLSFYAFACASLFFNELSKHKDL